MNLKDVSYVANPISAEHIHEEGLFLELFCNVINPKLLRAGLQDTFLIHMGI